MISDSNYIESSFFVCESGGRNLIALAISVRNSTTTPPSETQKFIYGYSGYKDLLLEGIYTIY